MEMTLPNWRMNFSIPPVAGFPLRFRRAYISTAVESISLQTQGSKPAPTEKREGNAGLVFGKSKFPN
jgi:hypothetical protein